MVIRWHSSQSPVYSTECDRVSCSTEHVSFAVDVAVDVEHD